MLDRRPASTVIRCEKPAKAASRERLKSVPEIMRGRPLATRDHFQLEASPAQLTGAGDHPTDQSQAISPLRRAGTT